MEIAISSNFLKKCERVVGEAIEQVAKESCLESVRLEKKMNMDISQKEDV